MSYAANCGRSLLLMGALVAAVPLPAYGEPLTLAPNWTPPTIVVRPDSQLAAGQRSELEQLSITFIHSYFAHLSSPEAVSSYFDRDYAYVIDFYGKRVEREAVKKEKARFVQRWPIRRYVPRADTIRVSCSSNLPVCRVTGLVDFQCESPERQARTAGVARFDAQVLTVDGEARIMGEASKVISPS
jgi:hypothetical protein